MKKITALFCICLLLLPLSIFPGTAAALPTITKDGVVYTCVNTKAAYNEMVWRAINAHEEKVDVYYLPEEKEWDNSYSNDIRNFTHYDSQEQFNAFSDYNAATVCISATPAPVIDENGIITGTTKEHFGTIEVTYLDSKAELKKADAEIKRILSGIAGKSKADQIYYIADYICQKAQYGSQKLPGGGYDSINGVYDVLFGVHTNTVCTSYAMTMKRFLDLMGLKNVLLSNKNMNHVWNMVNLEGEWYGIDCTFADGNPDAYVLMGLDQLGNYNTPPVTPVANFAKTHKIAAHAYNTKNAPVSSVPSTSQSTSSQNTASQTASTADTSSQDTGSTVSRAPKPTVKTVDVTAKPKIKPEIFARAAKDKTDLIFKGKNYSWRFTKDALQNTRVQKTFDTTVTLGDALSRKQRTQIEQAAGKTDIYPFAFAHHGALPAEAELSIRIAEEYIGKEVCIYYLDADNKPVLNGRATVSDDALLTFSTDHCSLWFLSESSLPAASDVMVFPVWGWVLIGIVILLSAAGIVASVLVFRKKYSAKAKKGKQR